MFRTAVTMGMVAVSAMAACKGSSNEAPGAVRFLPAEPDTAFRLDISRVRTWPIYAQLTPVALTSVEMILKAAQEKCDLDVMGTATTIIGAKKDALMAGDVTLIVAGLAKDKVVACLDKVAASKSIVELTRDGDMFQTKVQGRSMASGAILPTGEVVVVARRGAGVEPAAWKAEVEQGAIAVPAWWTELGAYMGEPIAVRTADDKRTVFATAAFNDGLAIRAKVVTKTSDDAKRDMAAINAIFQFLKSGNAADGKVEQQGAILVAELTAKGPQLEPLIKAGGPVLFTRGAEVPTPEAATGPHDCKELTDAVRTYMQAALVSAGNAPQMAEMVAKITPALEKAYVDSCTEGKWTDAAIECHVVNAKNLPKFEKCRIQMTEEQRAPFDKAVAAALAPATQALSPAAGSGSAGSGSAGSGSAK